MATIVLVCDSIPMVDRVDFSSEAATAAGDLSSSSSNASSTSIVLPPTGDPTTTTTTTNSRTPEEEAARTTTMTPASLPFLRQASFTEPESFVLNALFVDKSRDNSNNQNNNEDDKNPVAITMVPSFDCGGRGGDGRMLSMDDDVDTDELNSKTSEQINNPRTSGRTPQRQLSANMLSMVLPSTTAGLPPPPPVATTTTTTTAAATAAISARELPKRVSILGLWSAHAAGVHPRTLIQQHQHQVATTTTSVSSNYEKQQPQPEAKKNTAHATETNNPSIPVQEIKIISKADGEQDDMSFPSDVEVVIGEDDNADDDSWDSQDDRNHHSYDAWEVLKDEYANEFGFGFLPTTTTTSATTTKQDSVEEDDRPPGFVILGTSADDTSAQPHVLSPPLLDSLMNFLPETMAGQNYWLRYSLVRDGASMATLLRYIRAAEHTILALETPDGQVFGAYCPSSWRPHPSYYGSAHGAFVWKMRYSRRTPCASLFAQAQLESEIDVYMATPPDPEEPIQVCRHDLLGVGGYDEEDNITLLDEDNRATTAIRTSRGFAIAIDENLDRGTTSFSATFLNPSLCGQQQQHVDQPETFVIANLEVWSLTPCFDVETAERLEMRKYWVEHNNGSPIYSPSSRSVATHHSSSVPSSAGGRSRERSHSSPSAGTRGVLVADLTQDAFFRRVGHDVEGESRREHWQYLNLMNNPELRGGQPKNRLGSSPRFT